MTTPNAVEELPDFSAAFVPTRPAYQRPTPRPEPATDRDRLLDCPHPEHATINEARSLRSYHLCGRGTVAIYNLSSHVLKLVPLTCKNWRCPTCGPLLRREWANRIADAAPERFITLTCDSNRFDNVKAAFAAMKEAFPKLVKVLRKMKFRFEYCMIWEITENGWPHIHVAQKGDFIPQKIISKLWGDLGIGVIVDIRAIKGARNAAHYVTKYMCKTMTQKDAMPYGYRIVQASGKFFARAEPKPAGLFDPNKRTVFCPCHPADLVAKLLDEFHFVGGHVPGRPIIEMTRLYNPPDESEVEAMLAAMTRWKV